MELFTFNPLVVALIPVSVGMVEIIKQIGIPSRFASLFALAIGIGLVALTGANWQVSVASGLVVGLATSGFYSSAKSIIQG